MSFVRRQLVTAALTANALRPLPGLPGGGPVDGGGWLTSELAPHLLALTAADTRPRAAPAAAAAAPGLALAAGSLGRAGGAGRPVRAGPGVRRPGARRGARRRLPRPARRPRHTDLDLSTAAAPAGDAVPAWPTTRSRCIKDVAYDTEHGKRGLLDVYRPRDADLGGAPVLLQVHGGALVDRRQGAPGHPADAAHGRARLGVRRDQLPAQPARRRSPPTSST